MITAVNTAMERLIQSVEDLAKAVESHQDNPRIKRREGNAFVLKLSDLGTNWTPEYHDFKLQYEAIAALLRRNPFQAVSVLQSAVAKGTVDTERKKNLRMHPDVVASLQRLLTDNSVQEEAHDAEGEEKQQA